MSLAKKVAESGFLSIHPFLLSAAREESHTFTVCHPNYLGPPRLSQYHDCSPQQHQRNSRERGLDWRVRDLVEREDRVELTRAHRLGSFETARTA